VLGAADATAYILLLHVVLTVAHHLPTFIRVYGDVDLFRRFKWTFVLAPAIPLAFATAALVYLNVHDYPVENVLYLFVLLALWDPWHFLMQHYGFTRIYDRHNAAPKKLAARMDLVLSTQGLNRVLEHAAGDMTCTVEAGCTITALRQVLARHGQRLALDPLWPDCATVGGVLATNDSGPLRQAFGSARDLLIGVTIALPDGTLARSGGKVVKNVAGYDLPKLMVGALGTLGVITQATFRLHPLPRESGTLVFASEVRALRFARPARDSGRPSGVKTCGCRRISFSVMALTASAISNSPSSAAICA